MFLQFIVRFATNFQLHLHICWLRIVIVTISYLSTLLEYAAKSIDTTVLDHH